MGCGDEKLSKSLTQTFTAHCNAMICQQVTLSGDAEWPKVADAVIEALIAAQIFVEVIAVFHIERFLKADKIRADFVEVLAEARDARFAIKGKPEWNVPNI